MKQDVVTYLTAPYLSATERQFAEARQHMARVAAACRDDYRQADAWASEPRHQKTWQRRCPSVWSQLSAWLRSVVHV